MATGFSTQLTRQIGEHLAVAKLGKIGIIATPFAGNVPEIDILAVNELGHTVPIQVKAINGPSWQFDAKKYLVIQFEKDKSQTVTKKQKLAQPNLICIFILLQQNNEDIFYIFRQKDLQKIIANNYRGGLRPKNPDSTHCAVWPKELERFKDCWEIIREDLS